MKTENIKEVTNQAIEQLAEALNAGHSETLTRYLAAMAKFRAYSVFNILLILRQCPNAGRVAGYRTWQSFGRQVKHGEQGIMILAPIFRKQAEEEDESRTMKKSARVVAYRPVYVWDRLSRDLRPSLCAPERLLGTARSLCASKRHFDRLFSRHRTGQRCCRERKNHSTAEANDGRNIRNASTRAGSLMW